MTTQTLMPDVRAGLRRDVQQPQRAVTSRSAFPVRRALQVGVSLTVLVALLVLVLPSVTGASWASATKALASVSLWQLAGLTALWLIGLWAYSFVLAASLPGLSKGQGFVLNLVGSGASNLVPFGGAVGVGVTWTMARQYGFTHRAIGLYTAVTGIWNLLARLALPLAGLVALLVVGARVSGPILVAAGVGAAVCALVVALVVAALASDRFATRLIAVLVRAAGSFARLTGRPEPEGLETSLASQRVSAVELLKRGRGGLVVGMLAYLVPPGRAHVGLPRSRRKRSGLGRGDRCLRLRPDADDRGPHPRRHRLRRDRYRRRAHRSRRGPGCLGRRRAALQLLHLRLRDPRRGPGLPVALGARGWRRQGQSGRTVSECAAG